MLSLKDSMGLLNLFETTYRHSLQAMYVINEAWYFHLFLKSVKPFMKKETSEKLHQIKGSPLETTVELQKRGISFYPSKSTRKSVLYKS